MPPPLSVFIHTNERQLLGALVSAHSMKRNSRTPEAFEVRLIHRRDYPFFDAREGQLFLREGEQRPWRNDDLQSFTPLRFLPPELMGYQGRAVVTDPDVFAVGDIHELLSRDMQGHAILCKARPGPKRYASSVMLLDCARLTHWRCEAQFAELFTFQRDYLDWISLKYEPEGSIGLFEEEWNHFDTLEASTKLLHNTKRITQPWKTGLPIDFVPGADRDHSLAGLLRAVKRKVKSQFKPKKTYKTHPDPKQEAFFFGLLRECLEQGTVTEALLRAEMAKGHIRADAFAVLERQGRSLAA